MLNLQVNSLKWALSQALNYGDTDVFPTPFEFAAIEFDWQNIVSLLSSQDILEWPVRPHRSLLSPKAKYGFRFITQLDPLDYLIFSATVKEIASDIEARRIPNSRNRVFSYRYEHNDEGRLFSQDVGYSTFLDACWNKIKHEPGVSYVATADIADFYSRIYHHRLENALQTATSRASHIKAIMRLLAGWNGTETFGIPVGNAPSRLLAELTISDVDEALLAKGINFIRFNDDYRIFANSFSEAYQHIAFLAEILSTNHGLYLQPQKTTINPVDEFCNRFLVTTDDKVLDSLFAQFDQLVAELGLLPSAFLKEYSYIHLYET